MKIRVIFHLCLFVFTFTSPVLGDWCEIDPTVSTDLSMERWTDLPDRPVRNFVFYARNRKGFDAGAEKVFLPENSKFYPVARVVASPLVRRLLRSPNSPGESLAARLYANLRLKKTFQEYIRVQKKAREFLKDLLWLETKGTLTAMVISSSFESKGPHEAAKLSESERITAEFRQALVEAGPGGSSSAPEAIRSFSAAVSPVRKDSMLIAQQRSKVRDLQGFFRSRSAQGWRGDRPLEKFSSSESWCGPGILRNLDEEKQELPWILRAAFKTFSFIMGHKFEILALFFCVFFLSALLSIHYRRK